MKVEENLKLKEKNAHRVGLQMQRKQAPSPKIKLHTVIGNYCCQSWFKY